MSSASTSAAWSRFTELERTRWSRLSAEISVPLTGAEIEDLRGLGETINLEEVQQVYLPVSRLLNLYVNAASGFAAAGTVHHWCGGLGRCGQVHNRPRVAGVITPLAFHPEGAARHH